MAKHEITFTVPERPLSNADIEFKVRRNGEYLGTFGASKGGPEWRPKRGRSQKVSWATLANWIEAHRDGKLKRRVK